MTRKLTNEQIANLKINDPKLSYQTIADLDGTITRQRAQSIVKKYLEDNSLDISFKRVKKEKVKKADDPNHLRVDGHLASEVIKYIDCGKPNCETCNSGKKHGPYIYHVYRDDDGNLRTKYIGKVVKDGEK